MRILVWGNQLRNPDSAVRHWLVTGIEQAGHQVISVDPYPLTAVFGCRGMQELLDGDRRTCTPTHRGARRETEQQGRGAWTAHRRANRLTRLTLRMNASREACE